jgi:hypothetical protein
MNRFTELFRRHGTSASAVEERLDNTFRELTMFADAALMEVEAGALENARARDGAQWFLVGAAERLSERRGLDGDGFRALAAELVLRLGISREQAQADLLGYEGPTGDPVHDAALAEGAETMAAWLEGKDNNAPLRLTQLLVTWGRP